MVKVKSEADIKANYEASTGDVPRRFEQGVRTATWKDEAISGQDLYVEQMTKADVLARRRAGIEKVSDEEWRRNAIDKGKNVIGTRMKAASDKQVRGFSPYRSVIEGVQLPPRTADATQNVMNRVVPIAQALQDKKKELLR